MARKLKVVCDCGKPLIHTPGQDHRIKCSACVKVTKSKEVKQKAVEYLGGVCLDCGFDGHWVAFDFDHKDPKEKSFKISGSYMFLWRHLKKELDRCELRCCRCHRIKHYIQDYGE